MVTATGPGRRAIPLALVASGLVALVGVIVLANSLVTPVSFGWFAYAPLAGAMYPGPGVYIVSQLTVVGAIVLVLGLIGLSLAFGYLWGRGRGASEQAKPD